MKVLKDWTAEDFKRVSGREPEQDDLDRVNCKQAGAEGHKFCGVCKHGVPKIVICNKCTEKYARPYQNYTQI